MRAEGARGLARADEGDVAVAHHHRLGLRLPVIEGDDRSARIQRVRRNGGAMQCRQDRQGQQQFHGCAP